MQTKVPLGKITIKDEAAFALALAGQDPAFFLEKHASGDWGEEGAADNEEGLQEGSMVVSKFHTLRGHEIYVVTFLDKHETCLFCPPNSVIRYEPLPDFAHWYKKE
jgi:hypothetical protein